MINARYRGLVQGTKFNYSTHIQPIPPASRKTKGSQHGKGDPKKLKNIESVEHNHHFSPAEEGDIANIKQNTTNKGFYRGRRVK
jgi:hypothetical protein